MTAVADLAVVGDRLLTTITGRAVPYGSPTDVGPFVETIRRGCFADSLRVTPNLPLHLLHTDHTPAAGVTPLPVGVSVRWIDKHDGLYGEWKLDSSPEAQEAGRLVKAGMLRGLSLRFHSDVGGSVWSFRNGRDHVTRNRARLVSVSLVSVPAYPTSVVSEIRALDQGRGHDPVRARRDADLGGQALRGLGVARPAGDGVLDRPERVEHVDQRHVPASRQVQSG